MRGRARVEYRLELWINQTMHAHPLLASVVVQFSTWGVPLFGVLAVAMWLLSPPGDTTWKRACAAGLSAAAVGLLANQVISHIWHRPRPYELHSAIIPLLPRSADASFPSDHATAALSIAFGVLFVSRRAGWFFLGFGALIAVSRVLAGMHHPTDVVGSLVVSIAAGYFTARIAMQPVLVPLVHGLSRVTDPALAKLAYLRPVRRTILEPQVRAVLIAAAGVIVLGRILAAERSHLLDEMELTVVLAWIAVTALAVYLGKLRYWRTSAIG